MKMKHCSSLTFVSCKSIQFFFEVEHIETCMFVTKPNFLMHVGFRNVNLVDVGFCCWEEVAAGLV